MEEALDELKEGLWTSFGTLYALVTTWVFGVLVAPEVTFKQASMGRLIVCMSD